MATHRIASSTVDRKDGRPVSWSGRCSCGQPFGPFDSEHAAAAAWRLHRTERVHLPWARLAVAAAVLVLVGVVAYNVWRAL